MSLAITGFLPPSSSRKLPNRRPGRRPNDAAETDFRPILSSRSSNKISNMALFRVALLIGLALGPAYAQQTFEEVRTTDPVAFEFPQLADLKRESTTIPTPTSQAGACSAKGSLLDQIAAARICVADQPAGFLDKAGKLRKVAIAILDAAGSIRLVHIQQALDGPIKVIKGNAKIALRWNNRINSDFQVIDPPGGRVVSVRYPNKPNDLRIYTPYSPELVVPEVIAAGIQVKNEFIDRALGRLRAAKVPSRAFPGKLVADVIPRQVLSVLLVIEHINPADFVSAELTESQVAKVLVVLAANKELAYAHNISPAGASGLAQIMPLTYRMLVGGYPSAPIERNYEIGAADPINAIMAQLLLCDNDWMQINRFSFPEKISAEKIGPYLAACYNGGCRPVKHSILEGNAAWVEAPDLGNLPTSKQSRMTFAGHGKKRRKVPTFEIFEPETARYVLFYKWVLEYMQKIGAIVSDTPTR